MKKTEHLYRELLFQVMERKRRIFRQKELSDELGISLTNVNHALQPLKRMNAVKVKPMGFEVVNARKILFYWASIRNLGKDIVYSTRVEQPALQIEKAMPADAIFTAYSGYRFRFRDAPSDYSEVYVYASDLGVMKKRFPENRKNPNLFVLEKDSNMERYGKTATLANIFVDLWNLPQWYAKDYLKAMEGKIDGLLE